MSAREEVALIRFRLQMARQAFSRGAVADARTALRHLVASDFAGGAEVCGDQLAVLRDRQATAEEIQAAVEVLVSLRPRGAP